MTIEYRDTDGRKRTLRIEIDRQPPMIQINSPADGISSDDHTPDYDGSIEDTEAGIVKDSFRLVIDNEVDEAGGDNSDFVLNDCELWTGFGSGSASNCNNGNTDLLSGQQTA